jgi:hypothetical protein
MIWSLGFRFEDAGFRVKGAPLSATWQARLPGPRRARPPPAPAGASPLGQPGVWGLGLRVEGVGFRV